MITIDLNTDDLDVAFARLRAGLEDMIEPMHDIGDRLAESHQLRIEKSEGAPDGTPWAPKSPATRSRDTRPWLDSGDLVSSGINFQAGSDFVELIVSGRQVRALHFGAPRGAFGQTSNGRPIPWGDIPARPLVGLSDRDIDGISEALREWAEQLLSGGG